MGGAGSGGRGPKACPSIPHKAASPPKSSKKRGPYLLLEVAQVDIVLLDVEGVPAEHEVAEALRYLVCKGRAGLGEGKEGKGRGGGTVVFDRDVEAVPLDDELGAEDDAGPAAPLIALKPIQPLFPIPIPSFPMNDILQPDALKDGSKRALPQSVSAPTKSR